MAFGENFGCFGPTNVGLWRMAVAWESGEAGKVIELSGGLHPQLLPSVSRESIYWTDVGRAYGALAGKEQAAIGAFARAEAVAPQLFRANPVVRDTVGAMIRRARRRSSGEDLRRLAQCLGVYDPES